MRLHVLGNAGDYLAPLSGGSGYLVDGGGAAVLLDAGGGVRDALSRFDLERLDAVVVSHFHHDHVLDLVTLGAMMDARTTLVLPPGERKRLEALATAFAFEGRFEPDGPVVEAKPGEALRVGGLRLSFAPTQHSAPAFATRVEEGDATLVYASDGAPCAPLHGLARGADLLLMHALLPTVDAASDHARVHSTAQTAARLAVDAGAKRLLLSHRYWESGDAAMREAASAHPRVELARERAAYDVKGPEA